MGVFSKKPLSESINQSYSYCKKNLSWYHLLAYGISATIGSGIYVTIGVTAKNIAGPAVILSILLAGGLSCLTALCYLELSNIVPASGSSYSWGVTFLGEGIGWFLGWISTLEYAFAGSCTAVAISQYIYAIFPTLHPILLVKNFMDPDSFLLVFNFVALIIILLVSPIVVRGISFGANANNIIATINITILVCIVAIGCFYINPSNWNPFFLPNPIGGDASGSVLSGSLMMIYSFLGFDTICVFVADAISPRHVQIAVLGTLALATTLYMAVALIITGMIPISMIDVNTPLSSAFLDCDLYLTHIVIKICALCMLVATLLACLLGQPKIFQIISLDGLLPKIFSSGKGRENSVPMLNSLICCLLSALMATFFNVYSLVEIISTGALVVFTINASTVIIAKSTDKRIYLWTAIFVLGNLMTWIFYQHSVGFIWLLCMVIFLVCVPLVCLAWTFVKSTLLIRNRNPTNLYNENETPSTFCPLMPMIPCMSILGNTFILSTVSLVTWIQFSAWMCVGLCIYVFYGYRHSTIGTITTK